MADASAAPAAEEVSGNVILVSQVCEAPGGARGGCVVRVCGVRASFATLCAQDGEKFTLPTKLAQQSVLIKTMADEDVGDDDGACARARRVESPRPPPRGRRLRGAGRRPRGLRHRI